MGTAANEVCLELRHVGIDFQRQCVLRDVSLTIREQEIVSVIGPNGAGKTTIFGIVCGQLRPTRGSVFYRGHDITRWPPHRICHAGIGRTFQIARPFPEMTALENVLIGVWFGKQGNPPGRGRNSEGAELLELVGLSHKGNVPARELTLSELRRLEVARALATKPRLLLLDEIAAGLSPRAIAQAVKLVKALRDRGLTLILIDHFLNLTARVSDRLVALDQGEIIIEGKPAEVLEYPEVVSAYLGERQRRGEEEEGA